MHVGLRCAAGTITYIRKENCLYQSCPSVDCKKKVTEGMGGHGYFCEKCNQHFPNFKWRLMLSVSGGEGMGIVRCQCRGKEWVYIGERVHMCVCTYVHMHV